MSMATGAGMNRMTGHKDVIPKGYKKGSLTNFTPEAMQLYQQLFSHLGPDSFINKLAGGDQSMFEEMEAPAMRQFGQLQGQLSSRFSGGFGGERAMSARHGSGFQNAMNQQTSNFAEQLHSRRLAIREQALNDLMNMSNTLLGQNPYSNFLIKKEHKPSWWEKALGIGLPAVGAGAGGIFGGRAGAEIGANVGSAFGSKFF